ncbi:MAG: hypothetical protein U0T73_13050 [Chitinophagales bacterium]
MAAGALCVATLSLRCFTRSSFRTAPFSRATPIAAASLAVVVEEDAGDWEQHLNVP